MTCQERRAAFLSYLEGELAPAERAELDTHLAGCAACRDALAAERRLSEQLAALPPTPVPGDFEARFHARLAREAAAAPRGLRAWLGKLFDPRGLIATGGVAAAALALILVLQNGGPPELSRDVDWQIAEDPEAFELLQDPDLDVAEVADLLEKMDREGGPERGPG
jgi:anti-sigma factor RsiW